MNFVRAELIVGNQVSIMLGTNWNSLDTNERYQEYCSSVVFLQTSLHLARTNIPQYGSRAPYK